MTQHTTADRLEDYAREASKALMRLSGGGSEMFKRIGDDFYADPKLCVARAEEKLATLHKVIRSRSQEASR